jgi:hypothetical protein
MFGLFGKKAAPAQRPVTQITRKTSVAELGGGRRVEQDGWLQSGNYIQTEFEVSAASSAGGYFGAVAFSYDGHDGRITGTRIRLTPNDLLSPSHADYAAYEINCVSVSGDFVGTKNFEFGYDFVVTPVFNEHRGWLIEFQDAKAVFAGERYDLSTEDLVGKIICSENVKLSLVSRIREGERNTTTRQLFTVPLLDINGLRLSIGDVLGRDYVAKLLRQNGYETGT